MSQLWSSYQPTLCQQRVARASGAASPDRQSRWSKSRFHSHMHTYFKQEPHAEGHTVKTRSAILTSSDRTFLFVCFLPRSRPRCYTPVCTGGQGFRRARGQKGLCTARYDEMSDPNDVQATERKKAQRQQGHACSSKARPYILMPQ